MRFLALTISLLMASVAHAGQYSVTISTNASSVVTQLAGGGVAWTNPNQCKQNDTLYGEVTLGGFQQSDYINTHTWVGVSTFPARTTITGILVELKGYSTLADEFQIDTLYLTDNGVVASSANDTGKPLPDADDGSFGGKGLYAGGDGDLWGLTAAQALALVQQKFFGFKFLVTDFGGIGGTAYIDDTQITIYYDVRRPVKALTGAGV